MGIEGGWFHHRQADRQMSTRGIFEPSSSMTTASAASLVRPKAPFDMGSPCIHETKEDATPSGAGATRGRQIPESNIGPYGLQIAYSLLSYARQIQAISEQRVAATQAQDA